MSHIHIAAVTNALLAKKLTRICPECGTKQKVLKEYLKETVACSSCGASIPPKEESSDAR
jgi:uncharacterized protein (DUF983 family)